MINDIYYFNNQDVTTNVFLQIHKIINLIQFNENISFQQALEKFYESNTYNKLTQVENGLCFDSYNFLYNCFLNEYENYK